MSLARRHFQRATAAAASAAAADGAPIDATAYELQLLQLAEDRKRLKLIQSVERKIEVKRELLPQHDAWVAGALEAGRGGQDDVLTTMMVWRIDVGDIAGALDIADYVLEHGLAMPDQYSRTPATLVAEQVAEAALAQGAEVGFEVLQRAEALTASHDMPDEVRAKLHKAMGLVLLAEGEDADGNPQRGAEALEQLQRAVQLHERVGVKKEIEKLERQLRKSD